MRLIVRSVFAQSHSPAGRGRAPARSGDITGKVTSDGGLPWGRSKSRSRSWAGRAQQGRRTYTIVVPGARVSGQTVTLVSRRLGYKAQSAQVRSPRRRHARLRAGANPLQSAKWCDGAGTTSSTEKLGNVRNSVGAT